MRYLWLAIMVVTLAPATVASLLCNALAFLLIGPGPSVSSLAIHIKRWRLLRYS